MPSKQLVPRVKDLFADLKGIEVFEFSFESKDNCTLFSQDDVAWSPLNKLPSLLNAIVDINPRIIEIDPKNILVTKNLACNYPCVQDVYEQEITYPEIDMRGLLIRGGYFLQCDGSAKLMGPVYIGPAVQIRHNGGILGHVIIGDGETHNHPSEPGHEGHGGIIGQGVTVRRSIIRAGGKIHSGSEIVDCLIGRNVSIGPGAQFAHENFSGRLVSLPRFNDEPVSEPIQTGRQKLSIVIGDNCFIGANVTAYPGVVLFPNCRIPGGSVLKPGIYTPDYFKME
jgi:acetyltransferase-like isoleucine patch superfamily enzyme